MRVLLYGPGAKDEALQTFGYGKWAHARWKAFATAFGEENVTVTENIAHPVEGTFDIGIFVTLPAAIKQARSVFRKLQSFCERTYMEVLWETTNIPSWWVPLLEEFDGTIVGTEFCFTLVQKAIPHKPSYIVPFIVDPIETKSVEDRLNENIFRVLFIGQNTVRKGVRDAIVGFINALGHVPDTELIIKTDPASPTLGQPRVDDLVAECVAANTKTKLLTHISVIDDKLSNEAIHTLYEDSSLLLLPSRGEGFGIPYVEALLHGIPSVYVPFSATREVADYPCNYPVDFYLDAAYGMAKHGYEITSQYAVPYMSSLIAAIQNAYTVWKRERFRYYNSCVSARKDVLKRYSLGAASKAAKALSITCESRTS